MGGWALGGARNRDPIHKSLGPILVLAVCVVGIGTIWGVFSVFLGVKPPEDLLLLSALFLTPPLRVCTRCVGSYGGLQSSSS